MESKWLPSPPSHKPATVPHFFPDNALVSALIYQETATWKSDIIHEVFLPFDAKAILSIPLSPSLPTDRLIWTYTPSGQFTVSSAYRVACQARRDIHQGESSTSQPAVFFWCCIWKLPLPNKIKAFAWCVCRNILPTKANLYSRKITQDDVCDECGAVVESMAHVL